MQPIESKSTDADRLRRQGLTLDALAAELLRNGEAKNFVEAYDLAAGIKGVPQTQRMARVFAELGPIAAEKLRAVESAQATLAAAQADYQAVVREPFSLVNKEKALRGAIETARAAAAVAAGKCDAVRARRQRADDRITRAVNATGSPFIIDTLNDLSLYVAGLDMLLERMERSAAAAESAVRTAEADLDSFRHEHAGDLEEVDRKALESGRAV